MGCRGHVGTVGDGASSPPNLVELETHPVTKTTNQTPRQRKNGKSGPSEKKNGKNGKSGLSVFSERENPDENARGITPTRKSRTVRIFRFFKTEKNGKYGRPNYLLDLEKPRPSVFETRAYVRAPTNPRSLSVALRSLPHIALAWFPSSLLTSQPRPRKPLLIALRLVHWCHSRVPGARLAGPTQAGRIRLFCLSFCSGFRSFVHLPSHRASLVVTASSRSAPYFPRSS